MRNLLKVAMLLLLILLRQDFQVSYASSIPAFPGAEGFGAHTPGGRGGQVIEVTNLNDSGPGSLRACAETKGPRICVFRVAGTIEVKSRINIWNPYITIAGQTAPGGGITLKNAPLNTQAPLGILTHDVIIRYIRSRPGPSETQSSSVDAVTILHQEDGDHPTKGVYNVVIDHSSFSWGVDEVLNTWSDIHDVTIQWSIFSEGLNCSTHPKGCHSKGMLVGSDGAKNITIHHNLLAHNEGRNPLIKASGTVDVVNNVIHVPASIAAAVSGEYDNNFPVNFVGNRVTAPNGEGQVYGVWVLSGNPSIYVKGNIGPHRTQNNQAEKLFVRPENNGQNLITEVRHTAPEVASTSAFEAFDQVLAQVGATQGLNSKGDFFWRRDSVDERVIGDVKNNKARLINNPSEVDGWPTLSPGTPYADGDHDGMADSWEEIHSFDPDDSTDGSDDADRDGYTNIEEFLNGTSPMSAGNPPSTPTSTATPVPTNNPTPTPAPTFTPTPTEMYLSIESARNEVYAGSTVELNAKANKENYRYGLQITRIGPRL